MKPFVSLCGRARAPMARLVSHCSMMSLRAPFPRLIAAREPRWTMPRRHVRNARARKERERLAASRASGLGTLLPFSLCICSVLMIYTFQWALIAVSARCCTSRFDEWRFLVGHRDVFYRDLKFNLRGLVFTSYWLISFWCLGVGRHALLLCTVGLN